jgi:hypothetical protein
MTDTVDAVEEIYQEFWGDRPVQPHSAAHSRRLNMVLHRLLDGRYYKPAVLYGGAIWRGFDLANNTRRERRRERSGC